MYIMHYNALVSRKFGSFCKLFLFNVQSELNLLDALLVVRVKLATKPLTTVKCVFTSR